MQKDEGNLSNNLEVAMAKWKAGEVANMYTNYTIHTVPVLITCC